MQTLDFSDIYAGGDLCRRAQLNFNRMEEERYAGLNIYKNADPTWPGDTEGRSILAIVLDARATHRSPEYLDQIMEALPSHLNEKGYFGKVLDEGLFDEQQISSNSWALRALCEYYEWKKDQWVYDVIKSIIQNLMLPARGYYRKYPCKPEDRIVHGEASGTTTGRLIGHWYPSTDIGCAFIMLDGASHAYRILRMPELAELLDEMREVFLSIDKLKVSFQTHATLSATRGILRYYGSTGHADLLKAAEGLYNLYKAEGMTENYANYNWFGRPTWTEPCAIIDSFIVAVQLWQYTGSPDYMEDAHNIWFNGIGHGQRSNGGFGCDVCSGAADEFLYPLANVYEAYWCCTMRGGEGVSRAIEYSYSVDGSTLLIPFYNDSTAKFSFTDGEIVLRQMTGYPVEGYMRLEVVSSSCSGKKQLKLFIPSWVQQETVSLLLNGKPADFRMENGFAVIDTLLSTHDRLELNFFIGLRSVPTINKHSIGDHAHTYRHGSLILGCSTEKAVTISSGSELQYMGDAKYRISESGLTLSPINDLIDMPMEEGKKSRRQILFR